MNDHPTLARILDRVLDPARAEGDGGEERDELTVHLAACEDCREAERWARKLLEAIGEGPPRAAPEWLIDRALEIPDEEPRPQPEAGGWSLAVLARDAFARSALAGVRGAATGRRMLYEIAGGHVDLEIAPSREDGEHLRLRGQVIIDDRPPPDDLLVLLWSGRRVIARASGDAAGAFVFSHVAPGVYGLDLLSLTAQRAIRIAELTVEVEEP
jgi:hypothetical protein